MRAVFLIVVVLVTLALAGLEVIAIRYPPATAPLPSLSVSTPWH